MYVFGNKSKILFELRVERCFTKKFYNILYEVSEPEKYEILAPKE